MSNSRRAEGRSNSGPNGHSSNRANSGPNGYSSSPEVSPIREERDWEPVGWYGIGRPHDSLLPWVGMPTIPHRPAYLPTLSPQPAPFSAYPVQSPSPAPRGWQPLGSPPYGFSRRPPRPPRQQFNDSPHSPDMNPQRRDESNQSQGEQGSSESYHQGRQGRQSQTQESQQRRESQTQESQQRREPQNQELPLPRRMVRLMPRQSRTPNRYSTFMPPDVLLRAHEPPSDDDDEDLYQPALRNMRHRDPDPAVGPASPRVEAPPSLFCDGNARGEYAGGE